MNLSRRLEAWLRAGIIDESTADRIRAFEDTRKRPTALFALVGLGALAIGVGIIAIVAANWEAIPPSVKLAVDLVIAVALAFGIRLQLRRDRPWPAEALALIYYLFVLASIGLVMQVYQLGSPLHVALGVWSLATLPLLFLTRSRFAAVLWAAGLITTYILNAWEWLDAVDDAIKPDVALSLIVLLPAVLFLLGWALRFTNERVSRTFGEIAWTGTAGIAFASSFIWYGDVGADDVVTWGAGVAVVLVAIPLVLGRGLFGRHTGVAGMCLAAFVASLVVPLVLPHDDWDLLGGLVGMAVLGLFAFAAHQIGHRLAFGLLTAAIGIRIVTIYFEVFGSLMSTGVGLVTGGALALLMAWAWARTSRTLRGSFEEEGGDAG